MRNILSNSTDGIFTNSSYDDEGAVADFTNLETVVNVSPIPTSRIISSHPSALILGDPTSVVQTRSKVNKSSGAHAFVSYVQKQRRNNHKDLQHCLFACFLSQNEPKKNSEVFEDESWLMLCQDELLSISRYKSFGYYRFAFWERRLLAKIKDEEASDVDVHLYRSMIGSLMYLTTSMSDIMYLKGKPKLGLWYPRVSSFDLESNSDSDYVGANLDRKSTTGEAEYVVAASCCGQVLWIQNQMLDYGFNFMNTKIYIDNESTICIVKNPVYHSKIKHIAIRHHFIRDAYEKKLIQVLKIHTDDNVADLLTKAFDVSRFDVELIVIEKSFDVLKHSCTYIAHSWLPHSTDSADLVPAGQSCKHYKTLTKNTARVQMHNMVAYLEKTEGNAEFHEIIDFLTSSSIHHALTVSPVVSTTFVEQFWTSAKIDSLPNQAIFDAIQLMGHLDAKKKFVMYPRFVSIFLDKQLANVLVPLDHFPVNVLTSKVFSFMVKKGKHFSGNVTPLFASMLVQPTEDEGAPSERPSEAQPTPSPTQTSEVPLVPQTDPSPTHTRNEGEMTLQSVYDLCISLCTQVSDQAKEIQHLKAHIKKLKKQAKPVVKHHRAWMKSVSLKQRLARKRSSKKQWVHRESVSKQGRKFAKGEPTVHKDPLFDEIPEDSLEYMETEDAQDERRTRDIVGKEKEYAEDVLSTKDVLSTEDVLSTDKEKVSTDKEKVNTDRPIVSTDGSKVSTDRQKDSTDEQSKGTDDHTKEGRATQTTQTPTSTIFGDDETIAKVILNMSQAKAVS
ncbi:hypothetical protein Tco_0436423, partial [Tanacetum coccineum]